MGRTNKLRTTMAALLAVAALMTRVAPAREPATPPGPPAADRRVFPYPAHATVLSNGFKIVTVPYDSPGIVAFWIIVRVGSRDEVEPGRSGFAHFFEHMMFR